MQKLNMDSKLNVMVLIEGELRGIAQNRHEIEVMIEAYYGQELAEMSKDDIESNIELYPVLHALAPEDLGLQVASDVNIELNEETYEGEYYHVVDIDETFDTEHDLEVYIKEEIEAGRLTMDDVNIWDIEKREVTTVNVKAEHTDAEVEISGSWSMPKLSDFVSITIDDVVAEDIDLLTEEEIEELLEDEDDNFDEIFEQEQAQERMKWEEASEGLIVGREAVVSASDKLDRVIIVKIDDAHAYVRSLVRDITYWIPVFDVYPRKVDAKGLQKGDRVVVTVATYSAFMEGERGTIVDVEKTGSNGERYIVLGDDTKITNYFDTEEVARFKR